MPYVHTLIGFVPPSRDDGQPWTRIRVEESANRSGPWTELVTAALDPVDIDPLEPEARDITVNDAALASGWYRVTWLDAAGNLAPSTPVFAGSATRPTVLEVARLMPDRATADGGQGRPSFDSSTTPTDAAVDGLIDLVLDSVDVRVPDTTTAEVERAARNAVALTTAILVETGYFGEQSDVSDTRIGAWRTMLDVSTVILDAASQGDEPGGVRFGSITVTSPTLSSWGAVAGVNVAEILP